MSYTQPTDEMIAEARCANLCDYFRSNGYEVEQRRDELHIKGYGGLYINTETNEWHCFSLGGKNGGRNAVNCLMQMLGMDLKTAVTELSGYAPPVRSAERLTYAQSKPTKKELVLPEHADDMRKVFAYLCQTRKIDYKIVSDLVKDGLLYQDKRGNAVFIHRDESGQIVGAEIQGTSTYKRFKGVAAGTSDSLFSLKIGTPNRAYVFESTIDLLSFKQLANPAKIQNCVLVSMAGLKPNALNPLAERGLRLYSCVDNDEAGNRFTSSNGLTPCNRVLVENGVKDYNELLQLITHNRELTEQKSKTQVTTAAPNTSKSVSNVSRSRR